MHSPARILTPLVSAALACAFASAPLAQPVTAPAPTQGAAPREKIIIPLDLNASTRTPEKKPEPAAAPVTASGKPQLFVLPISDSANAGDSTVDTLTEAVALSLGRSKRYEILTQGDLRTVVNADAIRQALGCDKPECVRNLGAAVGAKLVVSGQLAKVGPDRILTLSLLDTDKAQAVARVQRNVHYALTAVVASRAADELLAKAAGELLGELAVISDPAGATVLVDGDELGVTAVPRFSLRPGKHVVIVQLEGYRLAQREVQIVGGQARTEVFSLEQTPAAVVTPAPAAATAAAAPIPVVEPAAPPTVATAAAPPTANDAPPTPETKARAGRQKYGAPVKAQHVTTFDGGLGLRVTHPLIVGETATAWRELGRNPLTAATYGFGIKLPLAGRFSARLDVDLMPRTNTPTSRVNRTRIESSRSIPTDLLQVGGELAMMWKLAPPFFVEASGGAGLRWTGYTRRLKAEGHSFDEAFQRQRRMASASGAIGAFGSDLYVALKARLSLPIDDESPPPGVGPLDSLSGFGVLTSIGLEAGFAL